MKRKLNDGLKERQEILRNKTVNSVEKAILNLRSEGYEINVKLLMERTGYSRPVFSKPHVLEMLKKYGVCRFKNIKGVPNNCGKNYLEDLEKHVNQLVKELEKTNKSLELALKRNIKQELEIKDIKDTNELLRGQLKMYYEKALAHGVDLD